jgi:hypothetical protein
MPLLLLPLRIRMHQRAARNAVADHVPVILRPDLPVVVRSSIPVRLSWAEDNQPISEEETYELADHCLQAASAGSTADRA